MKKWTEKEINDIVNLKGHDGEQIDIFDLYGLLYVGNCLDEPAWDPGKGRVITKSMWNLDRRFTKFSEHSLGFALDEFEGCETEDDVNEQFSELLKQTVTEKLI